MHIILGDQVTEEVASKYIILELDTFQVQNKDQAISAFCLVENIPVNELSQADQFRDLHAQMIKNYKQGNWNFCEQAIEHLVGRWNGEVDSFYHEISNRINNLKTNKTDIQNWNASVKI